MIQTSEVDRLLELGVGDTERLRHIRDSIEQNRPLYQSDIRYVANLSLTYPEAGQSPEPSVAQDLLPDSLREDPKKPLPDEPVADQFLYPYSVPETPGVQEQPGETQHRSVGLYKSEGVALCLSLTLGLVGFFGLGHRYVGAVWQGLGLLYLGWALFALNLVGTVPLAVSVLLEWAGIIQGDYWPPILDLLGYSHDSYTAPAVALLAVLPVTFLVSLVWQARGAQSLCRKYNLHMERTGARMLDPTRRQRAAFAAIAAAPFVIITSVLLGLPLL